ncbi:mobile mystery protein B [Flavobacterium sp.]|uniref:mobile mystery protein B n=1 Tax=Flavobacterium sp. TaxID=239 RepID=UPI0037530A35
MGLELEYEDGQTPLSEEEKEGLIIKSITTHSELNEHEQLNIEQAIRWILESKLNKEKILTEDFIRTLHKKMLGNVWAWAGEFRKSEKNIGVKWINIGVDLKMLLDDTKYWIANETYSSDEIAIQFKHRLVNIHCFPNGNGRHSRIMADIIIESIYKNNIFTWNHSNMVKADDTRKNYINAIREADKGNINSLIKFARE